MQSSIKACWSHSTIHVKRQWLLMKFFSLSLSSNIMRTDNSIANHTKKEDAFVRHSCEYSKGIDKSLWIMNFINQKQSTDRQSIDGKKYLLTSLSLPFSFLFFNILQPNFHPKSLPFRLARWFFTNQLLHLHLHLPLLECPSRDPLWCLFVATSSGEHYSCQVIYRFANIFTYLLDLLFSCQKSDCKVYLFWKGRQFPRNFC